MNISDDQKRGIATWVKEGLGLSEIQKKLQEEFDLKLTFMETRFLVDDLDLELVDPKPPAEAEKPPADANAELVDDGAGAGGVKVSLDRITQPGALVSGSVTFSDGKNSAWALDQAGRLILKAMSEGYKPSREDLELFQIEVSRQLERQGY
jgi:hypothetical protein